jgi:HD-GYP domain-containing protein (c-di-GMP phosphodiesterase class II)
VESGSGSLFKPEFVEALAAAAGRPGFWRGVAAAGDDDLRNDPAFGEAVLSESDLRGLAHLLWQIVDFRSRFTATHTSGVAAVAGFLAPLAGVGGAAGRRVAIAAGLHDLGKIAVPSETLDKERPLNREERASLHDHPLHGWRVLGHVPGLEQINTWANFHHERLDGSGYPFHVPAALIPLESRIVAVADVFTALTEERPYRRAMSGREAIGILRDMADGGALDHDVVAAMAVNSEQAAAVRRLAQDGASGRYLAFLEHAPSDTAGYPSA